MFKRVAGVIPRRRANLSTSRGHAVANLLDELTERGFVHNVTKSVFTALVVRHSSRSQPSVPSNYA